MFLRLLELKEEYLRCLATPTCAEEKQLPDNDTMRDRMNVLAFDSGLLEGVDARTAALCTEALEVSLFHF